MSARSLFFALALAGCAGGAEDAADSPPAESVQESSVEVVRLELPAGSSSWRGTLPCADCAGISTTLTLRADGTYRRSEAHLGTGAPGDTIFTSTGRWLRQDGDEPTLHLVSESGGARSFQAMGDGALRALAHDGRSIDSGVPHRLEPVSDPLHAGRFEAAVGFVYFADAALIVTCESGLRLPVAMEGAYRALEQAYSSAGYAGLDPMPVRVSGRLEERPAVDTEEVETVVVVEGHETSTQPCAAIELPGALAGTWRLVALEGEPLAPDGPSPTFSRDPVERRISGDAGCNRFSGTGTLRGSLLVTGPLVVTRRFCQGGMDLEARVLEALRSGGWLRLEDGRLVLRRGPDEVARYELDVTGG